MEANIGGVDETRKQKEAARRKGVEKARGRREGKRKKGGGGRNEWGVEEDGDGDQIVDCRL